MSLLQVTSLSKHFGSLIAVNDVSFHVEPGELHAVIGPNGAGKTTVFNLISGLMKPSAGHIRFADVDIDDMPPHRRVRAGIARTFQITEIFPELSVKENLRISVEVAAGFRLRPWLSRGERTMIQDSVQSLIERVGMSTKAERLVGELSHGDQRAVEIGLALSLQPKLLLLDEPTAGMGDQETEDITLLMQHLHRVEKQTIVLIEHDMSLVFRLAERITVLDQGKVLANGTPAEIASNEAVQAAYLGHAE
ncbi:MAG TPA: ABC transporter ATP-binding protein [bacterium]|nr:ABC transporter ATP-binding protein [bacterium]